MTIRMIVILRDEYPDISRDIDSKIFELARTCALNYLFDVDSRKLGSNMGHKTVGYGKYEVYLHDS